MEQAPGSLVRTVRERAGVTQSQLAIRAGTTKTAISRLERGHVSPSVSTIRRLLRCMGHDLALDATPRSVELDEAQWRAVRDLTHEERLEHGLQSIRSVQSLVGTARW